jgi:hypothetical protein
LTRARRAGNGPNVAQFEHHLFDERSLVQRRHCLASTIPLG